MQRSQTFIAPQNANRPTVTGVIPQPHGQIAEICLFLTNTICQMDRCFAIGPSVSLHDACICRARLTSKGDVLLYVPARGAGMFGVGVGSVACGSETGQAVCAYRMRLA